MRIHVATLLTLTAPFVSAPACGGDDAVEPSGTTTGTTTSSSSSTGAGECIPGAIRDCYSGPGGTVGNGICKLGVETCNEAGSGFDACSGEVTPATEDCTTPEDEDCDGVVNQPGAGCACEPGVSEDCYDGPPGTGDVGLCAVGTRTCDASGTAWSACDGQVLPAAEVCAAVGDEDCDGIGCSDPIWSKLIGDAAAQLAPRVAVDGQGNVIVAGRFEGTLDLGAGIVLTSAGGTDAFVVKLDGSGAPIWAKRFGGALSQAVTGVAVDALGNVLLTGAFEGTTNAGGLDLTSQGGVDGLAVKLAADGSHVWSSRFGSTGNQEPAGIAAAPSGEVLIVGSFDGSMYPCPMPPCVHTSKGSQDVFLRKLSADVGLVVWEKFFGDPVGQLGAAVAVDGVGNIAITGTISGTVSFGGANLTGGAFDPFVARFDPLGVHYWSKRFGDSATQFGNAVAFDSAGGVVIAGFMEGAVDFGGGPLVSPSPFVDGFLAKLDSAGAHVWSKQYGAAATSQAFAALAIDAADQVLAAGIFEGTIDFGGGSLSSVDAYDFVLAKLDGAGGHLWSKGLAAAGVPAVGGLAVSPSGDVLLTGTVDGAADFGTGLLTPAGSTDVFVAKFSP